MEPTSITAKINYWHPPPPGEPEPPFGIMTVAVRRRKYDVRPTKIYNLRLVENKFNLDDNGFQFVNYPTCERRWDDDAKIRERVYPEVEVLLKKQYGATHLYPMGHIIRRFSVEDDLKAIEGKPDDEVVNVEAPAAFAHVDQSYNGAQSLLNRYIADFPDRRLASNLAEMAKTNSRWAIINAWRPLKTVLREPLAICDAATVAESDLRAIPVHTPDGAYNNQRGERRGEIWQVAANLKQKWYWANQMTEDEMFLIKCYDSRKDGRVRRTPHSAIQTPNDHGPPRESIEMRWIVFWEGMNAEGVEKTSKL